MPKPIDYDALLKDFITDFFPEFIAFADPELYEAIDWSRGYTFLEQELINALRGKFKVRGKRKFTDKLVRVYLKTGEEHLVFIHAEFQHQPEVGFARRMYEYRALIGLRYGVEDISAIVRDFVNLPQTFENEFRETQYYLTFPKTETMTISKGTKEFAAGLYEHVFGYDPAVALEEERKQYKELLEKERTKAEEERQRMEAELQRTIHYLHDTLQMPSAEIAQVLSLDLAYIETLLEAQTESEE